MSTIEMKMLLVHLTLGLRHLHLAHRGSLANMTVGGLSVCALSGLCIASSTSPPPTRSAVHGSSRWTELEDPVSPMWLVLHLSHSVRICLPSDVILTHILTGWHLGVSLLANTLNVILLLKLLSNTSETPTKAIYSHIYNPTAVDFHWVLTT